MLKHYISLIAYKARADLLAEARRGYMGVFWWVIEPVLFMAVFYVVFVVVFRRGGDDAVAFLLIGLVVWKWFASTIPMCANSILANKGLIRQVYIPKMIMPFMVLTTATIKFFIIFFLLLVFLLLAGIMPSVHWFALLPMVFIQALMMLAVGCVLAATTPFLPDIKLIVENGMLLLFFVSGIFFDIATVPLEVKTYLYLNPMAGLIESYRAVLLKGMWPDWLLLANVFGFSLLGLMIGLILLHHYDRTYSKVV